MRKMELENRLIDFAVNISQETSGLYGETSLNHLAKQIARSSSSAALNYAEAQSAESKKDFIHKILLSLKELRETSICLKIISRVTSIPDEKSGSLIKENEELIKIFVRTWQTASKNMNKSH